jgi:hypothetical protein
LGFESDQGGFKIEENDARAEMIQFSSLSVVMAEKLLLVKVMRFRRIFSVPTITEPPIANVHDLFQLLNRGHSYFVISAKLFSFR